jgi:hypothetical protein
MSSGTTTLVLRPGQLAGRIGDLAGRPLVVVSALGGRARRSARVGPAPRSRRWRCHTPGEGHTPPGQPGDQPPHQRASRRDQQAEADDVGDEPGGQQQRPAEDDHRPVERFVRGHPALGEGSVEALPSGAALGASQGGADEPVDDQQRQSRKDADRLTDLDDHVDLGDRQDEEEQDQDEHRRPSLDRAVL